MRKLSMAVAMLMCLGCEPVTMNGDSCLPEDENRATCGGRDGQQFLLCSARKYVAYNCPGPSGCERKNDLVTCDFRGAQEFDGCPTIFSDTVAICSNSRSRLVCRNGAFKAEICPSSCEVTGTTANGSPQSVCR